MGVVEVKDVGADGGCLRLPHPGKQSLHYILYYYSSVYWSFPG